MTNIIYQNKKSIHMIKDNEQIKILTQLTQWSLSSNPFTKQSQQKSPY